MAPAETKIDFYLIFDAHYGRVKNVIASKVKDDWLAQDLAQETFLRAFKKIDGLKDKTSIGPWLIKIAKNLCLDYFRQDARNRLEQQNPGREITTADATSTEKALEKHQMSACVQKQMTHLPETYRNVLWLYEVMGLSQKEIAAVVNISLENVKVRLHRARLKFKAILKEQCSFEKDERNVIVCEPRDGLAISEGISDHGKPAN
jgi:RNA polymerase sigma-70 factor, ECF subfamily